MPDVQKMTGVHEKTVQGAQKFVPVRGRKRKTKEYPVQTKQVAHPGIWQEAMKQAKGDASRITVVSWSRVEVDLR